MTLFLIAIIVFFAIWGYQVLDRKAKKAEELKNNRTNIPVERQVKKKWVDELAPYLDVIKPDVTNIYDYIYQFYVKYDVPVYTFLGRDSAEEFRRGRSKANDDGEYEKEMLEWSMFYYDDNRRQICRVTKEDTDACETTCFASKFRASSLFGIDTEVAFREYCNTHTIRQRIFGSADVLGSDGKPAQNKTVAHLYYDLIDELTKRDMYYKGYKCSPDGVHGTPVEEWQKKLKQYEEDQKKYPWLYK